VRETKLGPLTVRIAGGEDREGGGDGPAVVLMHGFGAPGTDLVGLWRAIDAPRSVRWVFPEAPLALDSMFPGFDARAWWMIDMMKLQMAMASGAVRDLPKEKPEGLVEARAAVIEMLDALERELAPSALVLGGFSQGAMLATDVALHDPRPLAGLVVMSGTLLAEDEWVPRMASRRGLKMLQSHGSGDPILPLATAELLRDKMLEAGVDVTWVPFRGGHEIPGRVLDAFGGMLRAVS
jgi:phospholipase/carboxylesterase